MASYISIKISGVEQFFILLINHTLKISTEVLNLFLTFKEYFTLFTVYIGGTSVPQMFRGQLTGVGFSLPSTWVPGIEVRLAAARAFTQ